MCTQARIAELPGRACRLEAVTWRPEDRRVIDDRPMRRGAVFGALYVFSHRLVPGTIFHVLIDLRLLTVRR